MKTTYAKPTLVMNIKREFFAAILSTPRRKGVEYRAMTDFWLRRLAKVGRPPFNIRLLNGMLSPVPEATIEVTRVVKDQRNGQLQFHLGRVIELKHWNRKQECSGR